MASNPKSLVKKFATSLTGLAARPLDRDEREAVLGDVAESGRSELENFRDVAGLVLRRHAVEWNDWRPWLALLALIAPIGLFLSLVSRFTAQQTSVYLWLYANNSNWDLLHNRGFWYELGNSTLLVSGVYLKLTCWAWAAGFVIGCGVKKFWRSGYSSFVLTLFVGMVCASMYLPQYLEWVLRGRFAQNLPPHEDPVSQVLFYRTLLPVIVQVLIVALPAISAMRDGQERSSSVARQGMILLSLVVVGDMLLQNSILWIKLCGLYSMKVAMTIPHPGAWNVVAYWPVAYLLLRRLKQHQQPAAGQRSQIS